MPKTAGFIYILPGDHAHITREDRKTIADSARALDVGRPLMNNPIHVSGPGAPPDMDRYLSHIFGNERLKLAVNYLISQGVVMGRELQQREDRQKKL